MITTFGSDVTTTVGNGMLQVLANPESIQRVLFLVTITFGPKSAHAINDPTSPETLPATGSIVPIEKSLIADFVIDGQPVEAMTSIELLQGERPFFCNLTNTEPISDDLLSAF